MGDPSDLGRLHVITDTRPGRDPVGVVAAALDAGAPVVQVRGKELTDLALYELTCRVRDLCEAHGALCLVNDRVHVAQAAGAAGVHVGEHDLPVEVVRRISAPPFVVGGTARNAVTARSHEAAGATYLGVGPSFATSTKVGLPDALGVEGVRRVAEAVALPIIAIAGVTADRVPALLQAGAHGVAVVSAISEAVEPGKAVEELLTAIERGLR
jgi:thiamine-phosphate pyrophosphorylase